MTHNNKLPAQAIPLKKTWTMIGYGRSPFLLSQLTVPFSSSTNRLSEVVAFVDMLSKSVSLVVRSKLAQSSFLSIMEGFRVSISEFESLFDFFFLYIKCLFQKKCSKIASGNKNTNIAWHLQEAARHGGIPRFFSMYLNTGPMLNIRKKLYI